MHPALLLGFYSLLCVVASLSGGWLPLVIRLTHRRMQIAVSFVSGVVLGIGLLHLVPHSFELLGSIDATVLWVMAGFLFMFFLERFFHFHHHDAPEEPAGDDQHGHSHGDHGHGDHEIAHPPAQADALMSSNFSWSGAAIGLTLHGLVDGLAIAAAVTAETEMGVAAWAGLGAAVAVVLHKPFDSLTIGTLMAASGRSIRSRQLFNALYALVTPLGIGLFYLAVTHHSEVFAGLGQVLGFAAGAFICIASSDLLPELQFHRHDRTKLSLALFAGIALAWSTVFLESSGHAHRGGQDHGGGKRDLHDHEHDSPAGDRESHDSAE